MKEALDYALIKGATRFARLVAPFAAQALTPLQEE